MQQLYERYQRFRTEVFPERQHLFEHLENKQQPSILLITCSDSRVVPDMVLQNEPGDLFVCRNVGNVVPPYGEKMGGVSATIEYAVLALGVKAIVICGHSDCGAMTALLHPERVEKLPAVSSWLHLAEVARHVVAENYQHVEKDALLDVVIEENVIAQLENLRTHPSVAARLRKGDLELYGWVYKIHTGEIMAFDYVQGRFVPLDESMPLAITTPRRQMTEPLG